MHNLSKQIEKFDSDNLITILCKANYKGTSNHLFYKIYINLLFIYKIRKESRHFDAIISNLEGLPYLYLYIATIGIRIKKILWLHCEPNNYSKQLKIKDRIILALSIFLCNNMLCASPYVADNYKNKKKTLFLPNFIENNVSSNLNDKPPLFVDNNLSLLFVGSLAKLKRPWLVYDIALLLTKHKKNVEVNFYGDGPMLNELITYVKSNPSENVKFYFHGYQKINWSTFPQNSILIQPSLTEAMPMIFLEAVNSNIPILTNSFPGSEFFNNDGIIFHSDFNLMDVTLNKLLHIINLSNEEFNIRINNSKNLINLFFNNELNFTKLKSFLNQ